MLRPDGSIRQIVVLVMARRYLNDATQILHFYSARLHCGN